MKPVVTRGIVLARTDFGEADRILTVLTPDYGKVRLMAKGVRKVKSKLAGGIELFSISQLTFIPGKKDISTLISTRLEKHFGAIVGDLDRTILGYDILKLINRATEDMSDPEYFEVLAVVLAALDDAELSLELVRLWLYLHLLQLSGHTPNLKRDAQGAALSAAGQYSFDMDNMCFVAADSGPYDARHIKLLRLSAALEDPRRLKQVKDADAVLADCLRLAGLILGQHVRV